MGRAQQQPAGTPRRREKPKKRPNSKLTAILLAVLLLGAGIQLVSMFGQMQAAYAEEAMYAAQLKELIESNEKLREDIARSGDQSLIEDIARDELGMVKEGEKVFRFGD